MRCSALTKKTGVAETYMLHTSAFFFLMLADDDGRGRQIIITFAIVALR